MKEKRTEWLDVYNDKTIGQIDADILTAVYALLMVLIIVPNAFVAREICKHKRIRRPLTASKMILISLVITQILFALIVLPFNIYIVRTLEEPEKRKQISSRGFFSIFFLVFCLNATILVSAERNQLITDRKMHKCKYSVSRTRWKIALVFVVSAIWGIIHAVFLNQKNKNKLAALYTALALYIIFVLLTAVYLSLQILRKVALSMRNSTLSLHNKKNERRLSRTITLMAAEFSIFFFFNQAISIRDVWDA